MHVCRRPRPIEPAAMHACLCASLISRVLLCALVTARRLSLACARPTAAIAPHLDRRAPAHCSARTRRTGRCGAHCTGLTVGARGSCGSGSLGSVWLGSQAFSGATAFNANIGAWNTAAMTTMASVCALNAIASVCEVCASCLLVCFAHFSSIRMPSAASDRACGDACFCRASLISRVLLCELVTAHRLSPFAVIHRRRRGTASQWSSASTSNRTRSAHWTLARAMHWTDPVGARG